MISASLFPHVSGETPVGLLLTETNSFESKTALECLSIRNILPNAPSSRVHQPTCAVLECRLLVWSHATGPGGRWNRGSDLEPAVTQLRFVQARSEPCCLFTLTTALAVGTLYIPVGTRHAFVIDVVVNSREAGVPLRGHK